MSKIFPTIYFYCSLFILIFKAYLKLIFKKFFWQDFVKYSGKVLEIIKNLKTKVVIEENNNLSKISYPVIFISNHMSSLETLLFGYVLARHTRITFIVKKSLLYYPIFGRILKFLNPIVLSRTNPRKDFKIVLKKYRTLYKDKVSLVVFPQATRSLKIEENKFSSIGIKIAKIFNIGIVPIFVKTDFLSVGKIIRDIGSINIKKDVYIKIFPCILPEEINRNTNTQIIEMFKKEFFKSYLKK